MNEIKLFHFMSHLSAFLDTPLEPAVKSSLLTRSVSSEFSADLKHGDVRKTIRLILWWSHIEAESHWDNYNGQERQEVHSTPELSHSVPQLE